MGPTLRRPVAPLLLLAAVALGACRSPEPDQVLEVVGFESYWAVEAARGETQYIAPVARVMVRNKGPEPLRSVQATATFRREGEEGLTWGSAWEQVATPDVPLAQGDERLVLLKSDARYYSATAPEAMFEHELYKDATVEVYLRVGASRWIEFRRGEVERRIGSKTVEHLK